ncbi:BrxA family protein [Flammeovirga sp. EKP202]|uniref:BrxA family protein n=1 Tax=Flammeovirga sp. EKP202 TaxID=2770592 RepID=UPI00165F2CFB|nr:BrxA family protein [Flammeovirga sp. EKP202]MBD0402939.1 DUF1819 family protein [Flammeovirga sp. EKP202]
MKLNTDINVVGGIPDFYMLYKALPLLNEDRSRVKNLIVERNEFELRTEKSRERFMHSLYSAFYTENKDINKLCLNLIQYFEKDEQSQALICFWLFSIKNDLFFDLNINVFLKSYFQGKVGLTSNDVFAYLKEEILPKAENVKWSESTLKSLSSKYLTILKKFNLVDGVKQRTFKTLTITDELLAVFLHIHYFNEKKNNNLLKDDFVKLSFISQESLVERIKKIAGKGHIQMSYLGTSLYIEPKYSINNIIDGIFR